MSNGVSGTSFRDQLQAAWPDLDDKTIERAVTALELYKLRKDNERAEYERAKRHNSLSHTLGRFVGKVAMVAGLGVAGGLAINSTMGIPSEIVSESVTVSFEGCQSSPDKVVNPLIAAEIGAATALALAGGTKLLLGIAEV